MKNMRDNRPDRQGEHRTTLAKNTKIILATQEICGICGKPVDKNLKYPHPLAASIDHIIPVARGGHPSDLNNLQLTHWTCNRQKADKLLKEQHSGAGSVISNRNLPQSLDWGEYKAQ